MIALQAERVLSMPVVVAGLAAAVLAAVHVATPYLRFLRGTPRSVWLSVAGGVSVAYVFVHLLPELASGQRELSAALGAASGDRAAGGERLADRHVYLVALVGLAAFYGLERMAHRSRNEAADDAGTARRTDAVDANVAAESTSAAVFWIHMASFGLYNVLIGYLLVHGEHATSAVLMLFTAAMALHFLVTDYALFEHHQRRYHDVGRWLLALAVFVGLGAAVAVELPDAATATLIAFLAGGVILNVLKEEVPNERQSRFWAFAAGMAGYAALLLAL